MSNSPAPPTSARRRRARQRAGCADEHETTDHVRHNPRDWGAAAGNRGGHRVRLTALKVNGRIYAVIAINKEAEPNSLAVYLADFEQREALLAEDPGTYYLKPHYERDPVVLVRLACVTRDALEDLLRGAHRVVSSKLSVFAGWQREPGAEYRNRLVSELCRCGTPFGQLVDAPNWTKRRVAHGGRRSPARMPRMTSFGCGLCNH